MVDDDPGVDERVPRAQWLTSPEGQQALSLARDARRQAAGDALRGGTLLRSSVDLPPDLAAAALEQAELAETAATRHGIDEPGLLFTRDGLEAATRPVVADRRAQALARDGIRRVADLTGGLGLDTAAFLRAGLEVTSVERDPVIATFLRHNCPDATVIEADTTDPEVLASLLTGLEPTDVVFADPARRDPAAARDGRTARARPERDPERWSPPWSWVEGLSHPRVMAKVAPSFTPPPGWSAEWVSVDRTVVECTVRSWPAGAALRTATVIAPDGSTVQVQVQVEADDADGPLADSLGPWLHEIDPAVVQAGAIGALARSDRLAWLGPGTTWLTGDHCSSHPALRGHEVIADLPGNDRQARRQLADLGVTAATVKSRDASVTPRDALRALGLREGPGQSVVITTVAGRQHRVLVGPAQPRR